MPLLSARFDSGTIEGLDGCLLAAFAQAAGATLVTNDVAFSSYSGVDVVLVGSG